MDDVYLTHLLEIKNQLGQLQTMQKNIEREHIRGIEDQRSIKAAIRTLETRMNAMPDEQHREHHEYINMLIKESEQRQRIRSAVLEKLASGGVWAGICGIIILVWYGIKHKLGLGD